MDCWIDATLEEVHFAEEIMRLLDDSSSKIEFRKKAKLLLKENGNLWIKPELECLIGLFV